MKKITITGTKGKTTTTYVVSQVLQELGCNVVRVDTTGHYVNGIQKSTLDESRQVWGLVPTVSPGRYLWEFHANPELQNKGVAVMESSLGCSALAGMGYRHQEIGVFLNVMEDHIGSSDRLKTPMDIAKAKSFVFERLQSDGYAVFNADDKLVVDSLSKVPTDREITLIACGIDFKYIDLKKHLKGGGVAVLSNDQGDVLLKEGTKTTKLFSLKSIPWTFNATFEPSVYNLLHATAAIYAYFEGNLPAGFGAAMEACRLDPEGGRLTILRAKNGAQIIVDYAHEKHSLVRVAQLAKDMTKEEGRVIGVVRLAYDRTPELIQDTGRYISKSFDHFVVYDKIDGHFVQGENIKGRRFQKEVGKVSKLFADAIAESNPNVDRILREDEAYAAAAKIARPQDVVVVITNEDIKRSLGFIKNSFEAEFV